MFKKKLNLSALANKPIEQENQTSNIENTSILNEETPSLVNYNYDEVVVTENKESEIVEEKIEETPIKETSSEEIVSEEVVTEEVVTEASIVENKIEYNYDEVIVTENKENEVL